MWGKPISPHSHRGFLASRTSAFLLRGIVAALRKMERDTKTEACGATTYVTWARNRSCTYCVISTQKML